MSYERPNVGSQLQKQYDARLGEPDHFIPGAGTYGWGVGFWRVKGGVLRIEKGAFGWLKNTESLTDDRVIDLLAKVKAMPVREL